MKRGEIRAMRLYKNSCRHLENHLMLNAENLTSTLILHGNPQNPHDPGLVSNREDVRKFHDITLFN